MVVDKWEILNLVGWICGEEKLFFLIVGWSFGEVTDKHSLRDDAIYGHDQL